MRLLTSASALTAASALALGACARDGAPPLAPVEVAIADLPDAGPSVAPLASSPSSTSRANRCTARLRALPIRTGAGCTLDERISKGPGTLVYPCSGEGGVTAVFGEHRFEGTIAGGAMVLALTTELDWEDGCHWETRQGLRAPSWDRDHERESERRASLMKLAWTYTERPVSGTGCYGSCIASAEIEVLEETAP